MLSPFIVKSLSMVTQQKYLSAIELSYYPAEFQQRRRCQMQWAEFYFHNLWCVLWYTCSEHLFLYQSRIFSAQPESELQRMQYEGANRAGNLRASRNLGRSCKEWSNCLRILACKADCCHEGLVRPFCCATYASASSFTSLQCLSSSCPAKLPLPGLPKVQHHMGHHRGEKHKWLWNQWPTWRMYLKVAWLKPSMMMQLLQCSLGSLGHIEAVRAKFCSVKASVHTA